MKKRASETGIGSRRRAVALTLALGGWYGLVGIGCKATVGGGDTAGAGGSGNAGGGVAPTGTGGGPGIGGGSGCGAPTGAGGGTTVTDGGATGDLKPRAPFVAVGNAALRAYSADGKTWTTAPAPAPLPAGFSGAPATGDNQWLFRGGCYGAGKFVAVGGTVNDNGLLVSSPNGMAWTVVGKQSNDDCGYGLGRFLTSVRTSTDGVTWTTIATPIAARQIVFGHGLFVSVGDNGGGDVDYSSDGTSWKTLPITYKGSGGNTLGYTAVAYGNGRFVAINLTRADSPIFEWDGATTTSFTETPRASLLGSNLSVSAIAYGRGAFVIVAKGSLYRRMDGTTSWKATPYTGTYDTLASLVITDDLYLNTNAWSADGLTFTSSTNPPSQAVTRIVPTFAP